MKSTNSNKYEYNYKKIKMAFHMVKIKKGGTKKMNYKY